MITIKDLQYVKLLHEHKNFSIAAKHAGISQPALSTAISNLEERLGVVLFFRDTHGVRSSIFGDFISDSGKNILLDLENVVEDLRKIKEREKGKVFFGVGNVLAESILSDAIIDFATKTPDISPRFVMGYWYELREKLLDGEISFFVTANTYQDITDAELSQEDFMSLEVAFLARADHPIFAIDNPVCDDLVDYPIVSYKTNLAKKFILEKLTNEDKIQKLQINLPAGHLENLSSASDIIKKTNYLVMAPVKLFADELATGEFKKLALTDFELVVNFRVVTKTKTILSPAEKEMLACLEGAREKFLLK